MCLALRDTSRFKLLCFSEQVLDGAVLISRGQLEARPELTDGKGQRVNLPFAATASQRGCQGITP